MWRFGVLQKGSVRPCDNAKGSLHNACTHLKEHIVCETADWPVRMAAYLVRALGTSHDWGVLLGTEDIEKASIQEIGLFFPSTFKPCGATPRINKKVSGFVS